MDGETFEAFVLFAMWATIWGVIYLLATFT